MLASQEVYTSAPWKETQGDAARPSVGAGTVIFSLQSDTLALSTVCLTVTSQRACVNNKCLCRSQVAQTAKPTHPERKQYSKEKTLHYLKLATAIVVFPFMVGCFCSAKRHLYVHQEVPYSQ